LGVSNRRNGNDVSRRDDREPSGQNQTEESAEFRVISGQIANMAGSKCQILSTRWLPNPLGDRRQIEALSLHPGLNTPSATKRLEAARAAMANWQSYSHACQARHNAHRLRLAHR
jgi:hypothetical protein